MFRHCATQLLPQALSNSSTWNSTTKALASVLPAACSTAATVSRRQLSSSSARKADVVIVGAGHNGLVAALLLAKQGLKVQ
jgi:ribulose 1,5-bisphosphate synthetase/thiazole synthase